MRAEFERAAAALTGGGTIAMACHVNPDADALGSMLGLAAHLRTLGVEAVCSYPNEPLEVPRWAALLPGSDRIVEPAAFPETPDVMVTCDCASFDRLVMLGHAATRASELIWIDHHRSNDGYGTIRLVDPAASSTCEMVGRLIDVLGGDLTADVAACLYAGLVTDTGRFQYEATTPETLRFAARLREHDFDHARLVQALYDDNPRSFLEVLGVALGRLQHVASVDLVWTYLLQEDLRAYDVHAGDTDDLIDVIRTARDADVAAVLKQQRDGRFKVSVRSRGGHDLATAAAAFGGGGHRLAAGYTSEHGPAGTIDRLVDVLAGAPATHVSPGPAPEGLLLIDKPGGVTSHDAVARVRRALGTKKVGHAGTLDPMATGLLVIGVGRATRLLRFLGDLPKVYEGTFRLGIETTTLDADGEVVKETPVGAVSEDDAIRASMAARLGASAQTPPAFSAVKVGGRKLYEAARRGEHVEAPARIVRVDRFDLVRRDGADVAFACQVSGGTYVRVLAADVGGSLGVGAHLTALRRTAIGPFLVRDARPPDDPGVPLAAARAVGHLPRVELEPVEAEAAAHGRVLAPAGIDGPYGVYGPEGDLIGIWRDAGAKALPEMVLAPAAT